MANLKVLNKDADSRRGTQSLAFNFSAAKGLQEILKSNLGPKGSLKMLVSGAGDLKLTKDGNVLLHEMVKTVVFPIEILILLQFPLLRYEL